MAGTEDVTAHEEMDLEKLLNPDTDSSTLDRGNDLEEAATPEGAADTQEGAEGEDTVEGAVADDEQPRDTKGKFIPKARFDEAADKARERSAADAARIEALEAKLREQEETRRVAEDKTRFDPTAAQTKIDELTEAHTQAILDGKSKEATAMMRELTGLNRQIAEHEATAKAGQAGFRAAEEIRIELVLDELEAKYPELNQKDPKFDKETSRAVYEAAVDIQAGRGIPLSRALLQAAPKVFLERENKTLREEIEALKTGKPVKGEKGNSRTTNVDKNAATSNTTAPNANNVGADADKAGTRAQKVEVMKLTPEEYDALPAATKSRARGDEHVPS